MLQARRAHREQNTHVLCFPFTVANLDGQVVWKLGSDPPNNRFRTHKAGNPLGREATSH